MQEALGTDRIDRKGCAQLPFSDLDTDRRLYSFVDTSIADSLWIRIGRTRAPRLIPAVGAYGRPCGAAFRRDSRLRNMPNSLTVRLSLAISKRSDRRINVRNSSLSIASERWIIRASPDGLQ
jgi:hypothetical protein